MFARRETLASEHSVTERIMLVFLFIYYLNYLLLPNADAEYFFGAAR